MIFITIG